MSSTNSLIEHLRRGGAFAGGTELADGELLERFVRHRDSSALSLLVRRHAIMVWGVCSRVLRQPQDVEDAVQATFLVLVRRAASVVPRSMVANWLYGVARQTALKARATTLKRHQRERQAITLPEGVAPPCGSNDDLRSVLDEELGRLPDKFRTVLVLCELESKSRKEAAAQLGWPEGTVAGRLARAKVMLATQLHRRGFAVPGVALAATLAELSASAGIPADVMSSTIAATLEFASGQPLAAGAVSTSALALSREVTQAMFLRKMKTAGVALLALTLVGLGGSLFIGRAVLGGETPRGDKPKAENRKAERPKEPEESLKDLIEKNKALVDEYQRVTKEQGELFALNNHLQKDADSAKKLGERLQRMIETLKPMNKKMRDELGLSKNARVPTPEELDKKEPPKR